MRRPGLFVFSVESLGHGTLMVYRSATGSVPAGYRFRSWYGLSSAGDIHGGFPFSWARSWKPFNDYRR